MSFLLTLLAISPLGDVADVYSMTYSGVERTYETRFYFCNEENQASVQVSGSSFTLNNDFFIDARIHSVGLFFTNCEDSASVREVQVYFEPQGAEEVIARFTERFGTPKRSSYKDETSYRWVIGDNTMGVIVTHPYGFTYIEKKTVEEVSAPLKDSDTDDEPFSHYASVTSCIQLDPMLFSLPRDELKEHVARIGGVYGVLPADAAMEILSSGEPGSEIEVGSGQEVVRVVLPVENACGPNVLTSIQYILVFKSESLAPKAVVAMLTGLAPEM